MDLSLPSVVLEVSTNAGPYLAPTARDKLDLRVAKQSVNLWQATVAATACHRASGHAEQDDGCAQQVPERAPTRGRWRAKAPDQGQQQRQTGQLLRMPPCYRLEAPGGAKRSSASSSRCRTSSRRISSSRAWLATRQSGWLAALASSAWASVCSSRPIRFGFILAPRHPVPYAPAAAVESDSAIPEGPPGVARAFACEGSCGSVRCRAGRRPVGRAMGVCSTGCALRLVRCTRRGPELPPGAARSGIARGPVPNKPVIPGPTYSLGRAGPWLVPWTWSGQTPRRTGT